MSAALVLLVTVFRVLPHPPNLTPMGAVAVFSGRTMSKRRAYTVTLLSFFVSNLVLSKMYGFPVFGFIAMFVCAGFVAQVVLGRVFRTARGGTFIAASTGALAFFLISNFGVWMQGLMYPLTLDGLVQCYAMGLPFLQYTLAGNIAWTAILLGLHRVVTATKPVTVSASAR